MAIASWSEQIVTRFENIDAQHRALFSLMEEIEAEMASDPSNRGVGNRFRQLLEFTELHFATEENLMRKLDYRDMLTHLQAHRELRDRITDATAMHLDGADLHSELLAILSSWLVDHIREHDIPMARWMRGLAHHEEPPSTFAPGDPI
ncbi:MAG TPA: hemerythrin family protein [Fibrobacteria bacterium]|nr:hemerythrin family protein [Fibrobacteria bacterium]HOX53738.1 hemerythrin family protein [Fibrobacteria bacterium]